MESVTLLWIVFYAFIGLSSVQLVRFAGPLAIGGQYTVEELYPTDESGRLNVAYRILAPTICCQLPVFILAAICDALSVPGPSLRYLPTLFYWLFLGVTKHARGKLRYRTLPFSFEALMSLLLSVAFDHFVIDGYLGGQGLDVLDTSSIAFEFELALFGVVTFWISTFFKRYQIKRSSVYSRVIPSYVVPSYSAFSYSSIDTGEARLFAYEREYGDLLPQRFSNDLLLRSVFFAIMAIEDGNRPEFIRTIERMAAHFHLAKTTGIMQQKSNAPLSDVDSVKLAIPYIERMWDQFLVEFGRSAEGAGGDALRIFMDYYTYDYWTLSRAIRNHFAPFYGDYCGTRLLNANRVFCDVLEFEERQRYGLLPKTVSVTGSICAIELGWLSGECCYWSDYNTVVSCLLENDANGVKLVSKNDVSKTQITEMTSKLKEQGVSVLEVKYVPDASATIVCNGDSSKISSAAGCDWMVVG